MTRIEFNKIFRIANDGIYYDYGKIEFSLLHQENGFHGEEILSDGEFLIELHCDQKIAIVFPFNLFGRGQVAVQKARAKCGTCTLFLKEVGLNIKTLENS